MSCGNTLKKTAVLILILGCIALIVAHFIELSACTEPLAEAEEAILEHKDNRVHDADCSTCEELEEARATIYKAMALIWATSIKSLMFLCIGCGILVGIG